MAHSLLHTYTLPTGSFRETAGVIREGLPGSSAGDASGVASKVLGGRFSRLLWGEF